MSINGLPAPGLFERTERATKSLLTLYYQGVLYPPKRFLLRVDPGLMRGPTHHRILLLTESNLV